jgi:hypothetical protein
MKEDHYTLNMTRLVRFDLNFVLSCLFDAFRQCGAVYCNVRVEHTPSCFHSRCGAHPSVIRWVPGFFFFVGGEKLNFRLAPRLIVSGAIPLFPLYAFTA